ncbi:MAG: HEAT repeat domain-containing protein [Anaerolineae bacterium]|nr:HEAT repeat domain-containing protein [Anaerolineae bacterium]
MDADKATVAQLRAARNVNGLLATLGDEDPETRAQAAFALGVIGDPRAIPALEHALLMEDDADTHAHIHAALTHLREHARKLEQLTDATLNQLIDRLLDDDVDAAVAAAHALGQSQDKAAVVPLFILFRNARADHRLRLAAAEALTALESAPAIVTLLGALRSPDWEVRRNAAAMLGMVKADWAVIPLAAALDDPVEMVRRTAEAALERIDTPEALAELKAHREAFRG